MTIGRLRAANATSPAVPPARTVVPRHRIGPWLIGLALLPPILLPADQTYAQTGNPGSTPGQLTSPGEPLALPTSDSETEIDRPTVTLGLGLGIGPTYAGSNRFSHNVSPGLRVGWRGFNISTSAVAQARAISTESSSRETGITGPIVRRKRLGLGVGFALRRGRTVSDQERSLGLKDRRTTVIGRARARYFIADNLVLTATLSTDLLGRGSGIELPVGLSWHHRFNPRTLVTAEAGFAWANATAVDRDFSVGAQQSLASGLPVYSTRAGIREVGTSLAIVHEPVDHWVLLARLTLVQLTGPAASSPLVRRRFQPSLLLGLAYRFEL